MVKKKQEPGERKEMRIMATKRTCFFCDSKQNPSYTDSVALRKFMSDRAKIVPRMRSGACSKHQRNVARQIKYARHLAILPFIPKI